MNTNTIGTIGELKAMTSFIEHGFSIYAPLSGKEHYDFIACKDKLLIRVQVKSTSTRNINNNFSIQLKSSRPNRTTTHIINFDNTCSDILALYIAPIDTTCFVKSSNVQVKAAITFTESASKYARNTHVVSEYMDLSKVIAEFV